MSQENLLPPLPAASDDPGGLPRTVADAVKLTERIRTEVHRGVVGQERVVEQVLAAFLAGGHVLLEGVPGVGKTLLALSLARSFGGRFARMQFTPDLMPADVVGHTVYDAKTGELRIRRGPAFTHLLLADEINRAPAKTQAALLEVMQEQQITIEGRSHPLPPPFMTLATQNPIEFEGTYPLPEAQLDRFLLKTLIDYPSDVEEVELVRRVTSGRIGDKLDVSKVNQVATAEQVVALQQLVAQVTVDDRILDYAVRIVRATRRWQSLRVGVGPRGAIALVRVARAIAVLGQRDFVVPDDIKRIAGPALAHRTQVAPELEIEGVHAERVVAEILEQVEAPRS
jgi:MoxR-like ATPase